MSKNLRKSQLNNQKGLATFETIPLLVFFTLLISYGVGFFGVVHSGILNSISARTYAFDTFRHRTDLTYYRSNSIRRVPIHYDEHGMRFHLVIREKYDGEDFAASTRPIAFGKTREEPLGKATDHNEKIFDLDRRNQSVAVDPAWVMVGYGMCLNAQCGDQ